MDFKINISNNTFYSDYSNSLQYFLKIIKIWRINWEISFVYFILKLVWLSSNKHLRGIWNIIGWFIFLFLFLFLLFTIDEKNYCCQKYKILETIIWIYKVELIHFLCCKVLHLRIFAILDFLNCVISCAKSDLVF